MIPCPYARPEVINMDDAPEKTRRELLLGMLQKEFPSYHPLIAIARIAHRGDADLKLQFDCHKTIAKYVEPEIKSIEVKGEITGRHQVRVSLFDPPGAEYTPVEEMKPAIEGQSHRVLPGGANIDMDPVTTDRVVSHGW